MVNYLGGKCMRCGYNKCYRALEFHHRDPSTKEFGIATGEGRSWKRLEPELKKCDLLCSNCHAEVEEENYKAKYNMQGRAAIAQKRSGSLLRSGLQVQVLLAALMRTYRLWVWNGSGYTEVPTPDHMEFTM